MPTPLTIVMCKMMPVAEEVLEKLKARYKKKVREGARIVPKDAVRWLQKPQR